YFLGVFAPIKGTCLRHWNLEESHGIYPRSQSSQHKSCPVLQRRFRGKVPEFSPKTQEETVGAYKKKFSARSQSSRQKL
ncbi:hypothetical protein LINPERPRIM_LOCUS13028, partial [Linum perenne]